MREETTFIIGRMSSAVWLLDCSHYVGYVYDAGTNPLDFAVKPFYIYCRWVPGLLCVPCRVLGETGMEYLFLGIDVYCICRRD